MWSIELPSLKSLLMYDFDVCQLIIADLVFQFCFALNFISLGGGDLIEPAMCKF